MAEGTPPKETAPSSSYSTAVSRSRSPQSDLVSLSSTSDSEEQFSDFHSASQEDSDLTETDRNTRPRIQAGEVPPATATIDLPASVARTIGQGQSTQSSPASLPRRTTEQPESGQRPEAGTSIPPVQYPVQDSSKVQVSDYESAGLLYARAMKARDNIDLLSPADEVGEEVSDVAEAEDKGNIHLSPAQVRRVTDLTVQHPPLDVSRDRWVAPIDPGALLEMEKSARGIATEMTHVMDNLRNSLYAMTICTKQSMQLHRESIDNLHLAVDNNVKGMYTFMTKFEELHRSLSPMKQLAVQIQEMDDTLKVLERMFSKAKPQ